MEGLIPTLSGLSATGAGPYSNVGFESSNVWQGGYINQSVGTHLSTNAIFTALDGLWENNGMNNVTPGVYRADPSEIVADGGDLMRLANDILSQGAGLNYLLNISQDQISGVRAGAAVAEFVNPVTEVDAEADRSPLDVAGHGAADELPAPADVEPRGQRVGDDMRAGLRQCGLASHRRDLPLLAFSCSGPWWPMPRSTRAFFRVSRSATRLPSRDALSAPVGHKEARTPSRPGLLPTTEYGGGCRATLSSVTTDA